MSKVRKNINCKECGNPNPKGKQFCSDKCAHTNFLKRKKVKREATKHLRVLYNGISKIDEIKYYKNLIDKVSSYIELKKVDTMKHKRSYAWIVKYCKPKWIVSAEENIKRMKSEKAERDSQKLNEVTKLPYIKKVIQKYYNTENSLFVECECMNGHILKRKVVSLLKQIKCTTCELIELRDAKQSNKELELETNRIQREQDKLNKELERVRIVSEFIDSGEYKKYNSWAQTPLSYEYGWLRNGSGKGYLTNELKLELDKINYFIYKTVGARCPYPKKKEHSWCKHCETEQINDNFKGNKNICIECAKVYRRENYYEQGRIQGRINYHANPMIKLHTLVRVYIGSALKGKPKSKRTKDILGIEWNEFRDYIEGMFEPWMNWDNHGHGRGKWALQHIIPKTYAETEDDIYRLNYYKNLMPMDFSDNGALHDRILRYQLNEWHYDNCSDFLDKYKDSILDSMNEIYK
jgi:predicted nucleic acid-binding Zn ribbon protein